MFQPRFFFTMAAVTLVGILPLAAETSALAQTASTPRKTQPAPAAHVHGAASLQVAVDGKMLTLNFESPLDSLVGFEHAPRTDRQKDAVRRMGQQLRRTETLFVPTPAARCTPQSVKLESEVITASMLDPDGKQPSAVSRPADPPAKKQSGHHEESAHAEIEGEFIFRCENPENLRDLEAKLFDVFPKVTRLDVQVAARKGQKSARLSPGTRRVSW